MNLSEWYCVILLTISISKDADLKIAAGPELVSKAKESYKLKKVDKPAGIFETRVLSSDDVSYFLYKSKGKWEELNSSKPETFKSSGIESSKPFKIAIHGFLSSCNFTDYPQDIFDAYLSSKEGYNLICVDWSSLSRPNLEIEGLFHYPKAVQYTLFVGDEIEKFIQVLLANNYLGNASDVHLIGHSLGAHIAGVSGHQFFKQNKIKVGRITGLDPAGPFYFLKDDESKAKLGKSDADFVDVIYSNKGQLGATKKLGHVNFLPNGGGKIQPFCLTENLLENLIEMASGICSHQAAIEFFVKSIRENIEACSCKSWKKFKKAAKNDKRKLGKCSKDSKVTGFGDKVSKTARGTFCLEIKKL